MLKYKIQTGIIIICVIALFVLQSIHSTATSLDNPEITEEMVEQDSDSSEQETSVSNTEETSEEERTDTSSESILPTEDKTEEEIAIEEMLSDEEKKEKGEEELNDLDDQTGMYYFFQKYLYDCNAVYFEAYIDYLELQVAACEEMYGLGEITEANLKSYQAQKTLAEAELKVAKNESAYNNLYLVKNGLDYSEADIKEIKEIESMDYYIEKYPKKDYMTIARYVTDYNNAIIQIHAKQTEISALSTSVKMAERLLEEGEISKLEYAEKEVSLAKAQYELEQQYVELNVAYWRLRKIIEI